MGHSPSISPIQKTLNTIYEIFGGLLTRFSNNFCFNKNRVITSVHSRIWVIPRPQGEIRLLDMLTLIVQATRTHVYRFKIFDEINKFLSGLVFLLAQKIQYLNQF